MCHLTFFLGRIEKFATGGIVGGVILMISGLCTLIIVAVRCCCYRAKRKRDQPATNVVTPPTNLQPLITAVDIETANANEKNGYPLRLAACPPPAYPSYPQESGGWPPKHAGHNNYTPYLV